MFKKMYEICFNINPRMTVRSSPYSSNALPRPEEFRNAGV